MIDWGRIVDMQFLDESKDSGSWRQFVSGAAILERYNLILAKAFASRVHGLLFRIAARVDPVCWYGGVTLAFFCSCIALLNLNVGVLVEAKWLIIDLGLAPLALWIIWGSYRVPYVQAPTIWCSVHRNATLAVHLGKKMPTGRSFVNACHAIMQLARENNFRCIELHSAIFGDPEREAAWVEWLGRRMHDIAPRATIRIADREPLGRYVSFRYRLSIGKGHGVVADCGRLKAARILIENFE